MQKPIPTTTPEKHPSGDLEVIDFSDVSELEESIAPVFFNPPSGGTCNHLGCICFGPINI